MCSYCSSTTHNTVMHEGYLAELKKPNPYRFLADTNAQDSANKWLKENDPKAKFKQRVEDDIDNLMISVLDWTEPAPKELEYTPDLSSYKDSLDIAIKNCPHDALMNTMFMREWHCLDCGKYFDKQSIKDVVKRKGLWGLL